jgi:hypothetical protein
MSSSSFRMRRFYDELGIYRMAKLSRQQIDGGCAAHRVRHYCHTVTINGQSLREPQV